MGFFGEFNAWLTGILNAYIGQTLAVIAGILEPVIVTLGVLYVIVWGYLQLTGRIEEPFIEGAKRLLTLGVVLGLSLQLWLYNDVFVDTFFNAPTELAASIIAARNPGGPAFLLIASSFSFKTCMALFNDFFDSSNCFCNLRTSEPSFK